MTRSLRVVNGYLAGFLRSFRNVFTRIFRGVVAQAKGRLGSVFRLDGNCFCASIEVGDGALDGLQSALANMINLFGGLFASLGSVVHNTSLPSFNPWNDSFAAAPAISVP